jgi:hypothetical protein
MRLGLKAGVLVLVVLGMLGNVACGHKLAPLLTPVSAAGITSAGTPFLPQQVEEATYQGAIARGWQVVHRQPGLVVADISTNGQGARVRILSDASGWRIEHEQSSPGLYWTQHPTRGPMIHRHYNNWVKKLDDSIRRALYIQMYAQPVTAGGYAPAPVPVQPPPPPPPDATQPQPAPAPAAPPPAK